MSFTAYILDVLTDSVYPAKITIENGLYKEIIPVVEDNVETDIDGLMIPGFIDAHIHIESSMLTPARFASLAVRFGTTSVVCDPHEIANVAGMEGIDFMIDNAKSVPFNFYFSAPSCVPATFFETSGAVLDSDDINELLKRDEVVALGEMMNFPGVLNGDEEVLKKIEYAHNYKKPIDGHAPLLLGEDIDKYIAKGISTDHECSIFSEAIEKKHKGMKIMVRDGSSAKNMEALFNFTERVNHWRNQNNFGMIPTEVLERRIQKPIFDFIVSDDKHPNDLLKGHLNESIKKAVDLDVDIIGAIGMVTINPATHYNLNTGAILTGMQADFVIIDNLSDFNILRTYVGGECVYDGGDVLFDVEETSFKNTIDVDEKQASDFDVISDKNKVTVNVMECYNGELITGRCENTLNVVDNKVTIDLMEDIVKIAVVERYGGNSVVNGFIKGFNLKKGAIASSVSHDSHNIIVVGCSSRDMARAVNIIAENHGGFSVVDGDSEDYLPLPIAGLMSNDSPENVASKLDDLENAAASLGCKLDSPFMTMSFMALLVIPTLKISDKGLFDMAEFSFVDLVKN